MASKQHASVANLEARMKALMEAPTPSNEQESLDHLIQAADITVDTLRETIHAAKEGLANGDFRDHHRSDAIRAIKGYIKASAVNSIKFCEMLNILSSCNCEGRQVEVMGHPTRTVH